MGNRCSPDAKTYCCRRLVAGAAQFRTPLAGLAAGWRVFLAGKVFGFVFAPVGSLPPGLYLTRNRPRVAGRFLAAGCSLLPAGFRTLGF